MRAADGEAAQSSGPRARQPGAGLVLVAPRWPWGARDGVQGHASAPGPGHQQGHPGTKRPTTNPAPSHLLVLKEHNPTTNNPFLLPAHLETVLPILPIVEMSAFVSLLCHVSDVWSVLSEKIVSAVELIVLWHEV